MYSKHCETFQLERFAKRVMPECWCTNRKGREGFVELGQFDKHFVKKTRKRGIEHLTQRWTQSGSFFPKSGHFFQFSKRAGEASPLPPSCAPVSVVEYATISLNMPKYS